jgi:hypothetical protein
MVFDTFLHKLTTNFTNLHRKLATLKIRAKKGVDFSSKKLLIFEENFYLNVTRRSWLVTRDLCPVICGRWLVERSPRLYSGRAENTEIYKIRKI